MRLPCPLIGMRLESVIHKYAEAFFTRLLLEWQRDQVAETALWHGVLAGEQPVIRFEFQLQGSGTGVADYGRTEAARIPGQHGGQKENPGIGARAGAGNFQGDRHAKLAAGSGKSLGIVAPVGLVKIDGEEMASVAGEQRIDTDDMVADKVV